MTVHLRVTVPGGNLTARRVSQALDQADLARYRSNSRTEGNRFCIWLDMPGDNYRDSRILVIGALTRADTGLAATDVQVDPTHPRPSNRTGRQPGWPWRGRPTVIPKEAPGP